jgi:hypothetical protein
MVADTHAVWYPVPMHPLLILAAILIVLAYFPIVLVGGTKAQSTQFFIRMPDRGARPAFWAARALQERVEFFIRWLVTLAIALPLLALAWTYIAGAQAYITAVFILLASAWPKIGPALRQLEYVGHAVEVEGAIRKYGAERNAYVLSEATTMQRGYNGLFSHLTVEQVAAKVHARRPIARIFATLFGWRLARDFR